MIPDTTKTETSEDGGIVWTEVPAGTYRIVTSSPTTGFASFLATCADGRIVNANPPWGAYELSDGEQPLAAGVVASSATGVDAKGSGRDRRAIATLDSGEAVHVNAVLRQGRHAGRQGSGQGAGRQGRREADDQAARRCRRRGHDQAPGPATGRVTAPVSGARSPGLR